MARYATRSSEFNGMRGPMIQIYDLGNKSINLFVLYTSVLVKLNSLQPTITMIKIHSCFGLLERKATNKIVSIVRDEFKLCCLTPVLSLYCNHNLGYTTTLKREEVKLNRCCLGWCNAIKLDHFSHSLVCFFCKN